MEKDEKVVNPPHMPVAKNIRISFESKLDLSLKPKTILIIKLPTIFTTNVPTGNGSGNCLAKTAVQDNGTLHPKNSPDRL